MRWFLAVLAAWLLALVPAAWAWQVAPAVPAGAPSAVEIMARVAANQDRSEAARTRYVYVQHAHVISRKGKTIRCEETTETRIVPTPTGFTQKLLQLDGRLLGKHGYVSYTELPKAAARAGKAGEQARGAEPGKAAEPGDESDGDHDGSLVINLDGDSTLDRDLVENMRGNLTRSHSKDGIGAGLFPLTSKSQAAYAFQLVGAEHLNGRAVFHLTFAPKDKSDFDWKGDAYIDSTAYEPVVVRTTLSRRIPFAVRTLLGTSLPGLGFTVVYEPEPGGVWFPVSFGTEFKIKLLFFFHREMVISAQNCEFEQTHVTSTVLPAAGEAP